MADGPDLRKEVNIPAAMEKQAAVFPRGEKTACVSTIAASSCRKDTAAPAEPFKILGNLYFVGSAKRPDSALHARRIAQNYLSASAGAGASRGRSTETGSWSDMRRGGA